MRRRILAALIWLVATSSLVVVFVGCEEDIAAVHDRDTPFSLYGYLNSFADTQFVRVFPIVDKLEPTRPAPIDAVFTSTDLTTGDVRTWQDSLVQYHDGTYGHVFWAPFRAVPEHEYRLEIRRSDGALTYVEVDTPPRLTPNAQPQIIRFDEHGRPIAAIDPILLKGGTPRLLGLEVEYWVKYAFGSQYAEKVVIPYEGRQEAGSEGWIVEVDLRRDYSLVRDALFRRNLWTSESTYGIYILLVTLRTQVVNESWVFPEGEVSPDVLVEPGTFSNVVNGFGFVGSGYPLQRSWRPRDEGISATDFTLCPCVEYFCVFHAACS